MEKDPIGEIEMKIQALTYQKGRIEDNLAEFQKALPEMPGWVNNSQYPEDCARWFFANQVAGIPSKYIHSPIINGASVIGDSVKINSLLKKQEKELNSELNGKTGRSCSIFTLGFPLLVVAIGTFAHKSPLNQYFASLAGIAIYGLYVVFTMDDRRLSKLYSQQQMQKNSLNLLASDAANIGTVAGGIEFQEKMSTWRKCHRLSVALGRCTSGIGTLRANLHALEESAISASGVGPNELRAIEESYGLRPGDLTPPQQVNRLGPPPSPPF